MRTALVAFVCLAIGCGTSEPHCEDLVCGACPETVSLRVELAVGDGPVSIEGADIPCVASDPGTFVCSTGSIAIGAHSITISAPGYEPQSRTFTIGAAPAGCCTCPIGFEDDVTLERASTPVDGGVPDASDPGTDAATDADVARTCDPDAVAFPMGGSLSQGTLCDDVFACAESEAHAAAIIAASSRFECSPEPEGPCSGITCAYRDPGGPSTLDEAEVREICAVTLVTPTPAMTCRVYL